MKAKYVQRGDSVDFIPSDDLDAGEIVRLGNLIGITRIPVKRGSLGALTLNGIFDIRKPRGLSFPLGSHVFWDSETSSASDSGGILLGIAVMSAAGDAETVRVLLNSKLNDEENEATWLPL